MIGASIFSILGVGAQICGNSLPLAFGIGALVSLSVAYSYAKLGSAYVSNAGPIEFILRGIGNNVLTGTLSLLMWLSYVVSISLFVKAFTGYFIVLFGINPSALVHYIVAATIIVLFTLLNFFGSKAVGKTEFWIVLVKLSVLLFFVALGLWSINPEFLKPNLEKETGIDIFYAASVLFLTYMGFGLITNASENMENPKETVPKAIYLSILIVATVYILVSITAVGNLGAEGLVKAKEYALAQAAKPFLGDFGFNLIAIGALFSTSSAINATLYGGANVAYVLAKKGELPKVFERKVWFNEPEGLYITAVLSFLFGTYLDLSGISSLVSFVFLVIYVFVIASHLKLAGRGEVEGNVGLIALNFIIVFSVLIVLLEYQWNEAQRSFGTSISILILALAFELIYRNLSHRGFVKRSAVD